MPRFSSGCVFPLQEPLEKCWLCSCLEILELVVQVRSGSFRLGALLKHEAVPHVCSDRPVGWKSMSMTFPGISGMMPEPLSQLWTSLTDWFSTGPPVQLWAVTLWATHFHAA